MRKTISVVLLACMLLLGMVGTAYASSEEEPQETTAQTEVDEETFVECQGDAYASIDGCEDGQDSDESFVGEDPCTMVGPDDFYDEVDMDRAEFKWWEGCDWWPIEQPEQPTPEPEPETTPAPEPEPEVEQEDEATVVPPPAEPRRSGRRTGSNPS